MRSSSKLLALAFAGLALGACTTREAARAPSGGPRYASLDASLDGRRSVGPDVAPARIATPIAVLPAWIGPPRQLREGDGPDALEQTVSLGLAPRGEHRENLILLRLARTAEAGRATAMGGRPSEAGIRAELAAVFPDTPMQVVTRPAKNAYGPYGLAIGRTRQGARCLYAWQLIEDGPALDPTVDGAGPLSLRVRICRDDITLEAMAAAMNQLELVPRFGGTPIANAPASRARPALRRRAVAQATAPRRPLRPRQVERDDTRDEAEARTVAGAMQVKPIVAADRGPGAGLPPLPAGRRYLGVAEMPATQPDQTRDDPRDTPGPAAMRGGFVGAAPAPQPGILSADLPPEALRGPSARSPARP